MGIQFFAPDAPTTMKDVDYGDGEVVAERVSTLPEVDTSCETGAVLLRLLGLEWDGWGGQLAGEELDNAIAMAMRIANGMDVSSSVIDASESRGRVRVVESEGGVVTIGGGARTISFGVSEERIKRRMGELLGLFALARKGGYTVCWG